jgi:hypothetical protein
MGETTPMCVTSAKPVTITQPKKPKLDHGKFVAAGFSDPSIEFVVGRLIDKATNKIYHGRAVHDPPKWGIYFNVLKAKYKLEIIGISVNPHTGVPTAFSVSQDLEIDPRGPTYGVGITWPAATGDSACRSNFVPYGTYNPQGTITVTTQIGPSGQAIGADNVYQDPPNQFWSAQFSSLTQDSTDYQLDAYNSAGGHATCTSLTLDLAHC